jgi:hypothetical protein
VRIAATLALLCALTTACCQSSSAGKDGGASSGATNGGATAGGNGGTGGNGWSPVCGLNAQLCNGACVITLNNPTSCGGCGITCSSSQVCADGLCGAPSACPDGTIACSQTCIDPLTDDDNCGSCGNKCSGTLGCSTGLCVPTVGLTGQTPSCPNGGPPLTIATDAGSVCTGNLAQVTFRWALCSCSTIGENGVLDTDSFDSAVGPYVDGGLGGGVGANDAMTLNGAVGVGGSLWTASTSTLDLNGVSGVGLELHADGPLQANGVFDIGSNAFVNGDVTAYGVMTIGGALYVPSSATVGTLVSSKGTIVGPVTVPDPCDCAANQLIDVAAIVASGQASNDDTIIGLDPNVFVNGTGALRLDLPCGRYYLAAITFDGTATIAVHGHVALFVGGDIDPNGGLEITIDPQATLDLFIGGNLEFNGVDSFGSTLVPAQSRIYVAGSQVQFNGDQLLAGNFYLPYAQLAPNGNLDVFGSMFTGGYQDNGPTWVHYDSAILSAGAECGDAGVPSGCSSCGDCGNQACVNGTCGACATSADCCAPLVCNDGSCQGNFE